MRPRVTIVTPSFNQAAYLEEAIVSVLEQDYEPIEYIVVDGGSTDGSVEVIRQYQDRLAWWESKPDAGQAAALNDAFGRSTGELVGWLNSDDTLLPGSVSLVVAALDADPAALFAYGDALYTDGESRQTGYFRSDDLDVVQMIRTFTDHVNPQGALFRRRALELGSPLRGYYTFDYELVLKLGLAGRALRIDRPVATFRIHDESKSGSPSARRAEDYVEMVDRFFALADLPLEVRAVEAEARASCLVRAGQLFYVAGDHRRARECYVDALRLDSRVRRPATASLLARTLLPQRLAGWLRAQRPRPATP